MQLSGASVALAVVNISCVAAAIALLVAAIAAQSYR